MMISILFGKSTANPKIMQIPIYRIYLRYILHLKLVIFSNNINKSTTPN